MKKQAFGIIAALFALTLALVAGAYATDAETAELSAADVYAILYEDGELVFQYGDTPETGRAVKKTYEVDLTAVYYMYSKGGFSIPNTPWYNERESVRVVSFADKVSPTSTAYWFAYCGNLERVDNIQNLDTSNVTNMLCMFNGCSKLTALDVSHFDTKNVTNMRYMFCKCSGLTALDVSHFDTKNVTDMNYMFNGCSGLTALDVSHFDTKNVTDMNYMFNGCRGLTALDVSHFDTANVTDMGGMFSGCSGLTALDLSHFNTAKVTNMSHMFVYCRGLTALDVSHFDTANVTSMYGTFDSCSGLTALDLSHFNTAKVTNMGNMFLYCSGLTTLDVSHFDTANVTSIGGMFQYCSGLTALDVSHFDTANVTDMGRMFSGCSGLTALDVSHFDTKNVTSIDEMFNGCSKLKTICVSDKFTTASGTPSLFMFLNCTSLVGGSGTKYDESHTNKEYARIDNPPDAPGYFTAKDAAPVGYAITSVKMENGKLSVALTNPAPATLAVSYFDANGKFVFAQLKNVDANAGTLALDLLTGAATLRVMLLDSDFRPVGLL